MNTTKTKLNSSIFTISENGLEKIIEDMFSYIETYKPSLKILENYDEEVNNTSEDEVTEKLSEMAHLQELKELKNFVNKAVIKGSTIVDKSEELLKTIKSLSENELSFLLCDLPLEEDDIETIIPKVKTVIGDCSAIILTIISYREIVNEYERTGVMTIPVCLNNYLSKRGKFTEVDVLKLIQSLKDNIDKSGIKLSIFSGREDLEDDFFNSISDQLVRLAIETRIGRLTLKLVEDFLDKEIDEEELVKRVTGKTIENLYEGEDMGD